MPRDGSNIYHRPAGTDAVADTTIESSKYNSNVADVEQDLNTPRPIIAGGTGATSGPAALAALGGEQAQQVVTNYDTFPFVAGSFYSTPGATSAPNGSQYFLGICYTAAGGLICLEARVATGAPTVLGQKYVRTKDGTGWSAWFAQGTGSTADLDAAYVNVAGDAMTGNLIVGGNANTAYSAGVSVGMVAKNVAAGTGYFIQSNDPVASALVGQVALLTDPTAANRRLQIQAIEQGVAYRNVTLCETAGNVGIGKAVPGVPLDVVGVGQFSSDLYLGVGSASGALHFGSGGTTKYLNYDGTNFTLAGGNLNVVSGNISAQSTGATASLSMFNATSGDYLGFWGSAHLIGFGTLNASGTPTLAWGQIANSGFLMNGTIQANGGGVISTIGGSTSGTFYFGAVGSGRHLTCDGNSITAAVPGAGTFIANANAVQVVAPPGQIPRFDLTQTGQATWSSIQDNGGSFNFFSNSAQSAGMYILRGASAWTAISDARLPYKQTARELSVLDKVKGIQLYENEVNGRLELFGKAQEVYAVFPHVVDVGDDDPTFVPTGMADGRAWGLSYERLGITALQGVKELLAKIEALEARVAALEAA
jgi:hypothetical protein